MLLALQQALPGGRRRPRPPPPEGVPTATRSPSRCSRHCAAAPFRPARTRGCGRGCCSPTQPPARRARRFIFLQSGYGPVVPRERRPFGPIFFLLWFASRHFSLPLPSGQTPRGSAHNAWRKKAKRKEREARTRTEGSDGLPSLFFHQGVAVLLLLSFSSLLPFVDGAYAHTKLGRCR